MRRPRMPLPNLMCRILAAIVAMALLAVAVAACGGDGDTSPTPIPTEAAGSTGTPEPTPSPAAPTASPSTSEPVATATPVAATPEPTRAAPTATPAASEPVATATAVAATPEPTRAAPTATPVAEATGTPTPIPEPTAAATEAAATTAAATTAAATTAATEAPATEAAEEAAPAPVEDPADEPAESAGEEDASSEDAAVGDGRGGDPDDDMGDDDVADMADDDMADTDADMGDDDVADMADDDMADMDASMADDGMADDMADDGSPSEPASRSEDSEDAAEEYEDVAEVSEDGAEEYEERVQPALSAGEVNDNERWDEYLQYRDQYAGPTIHDVDISERYIITVSDSAEETVPNAEVRVSSGDTVLFEGRTYANGQTLFFPLAFAASEGVESFTLDVEKDGATQQLEFVRGENHDWDVTLELEQAATEGVPLDILFLLDSTGSMADEIDQIKATLLSIASRISDLPSQPDLRFGMVAYRDRGDAFVTRVYDFEPDPQRFVETIRGVVAHGGGDYPESLNEALHVAVHEPEWRSGDAIRLMFLIADAPPQLGYQDDYSYADDMIEAHRQGIKTFSIASSGLNQQGEYVFRQIAQHTMGRFIFIVYGGGGTTSHSVSDYTIGRLDDLVVSLVEEELAFLAR